MKNQSCESMCIGFCEILFTFAHTAGNTKGPFILFTHQNVIKATYDEITSIMYLIIQ